MFIIEPIDLRPILQLRLQLVCILLFRHDDCSLLGLFLPLHGLIQFLLVPHLLDHLLSQLVALRTGHHLVVGLVVPPLLQLELLLPLHRLLHLVVVGGEVVMAALPGHLLLVVHPLRLGHVLLIPESVVHIRGDLCLLLTLLFNVL